MTASASVLAQAREGAVRHTGVIQAAVKGELAYRFEFITGIVGTLLTTVMLYYLWTAIYRSSLSMEMAYTDLITYVVLGQAFSFARPGQRRMMMRIASGIRNGNVALDLLRPTDFQLLRLSETFGSFLMETAFVSLPAYALALLVFGINPPASAEAALGFAVSLLAAFLLAFSLDFVIGVLAFWTFSVWGLGYAKIALIDILAGTLIPLSLFPDWLQRVALALPFQGIAYTPLSIYVGTLTGPAIWSAIGVQLAWAIGLALLTRLLWLKARRRLIVQGG
ncbi:MAG: ABC-2 family transporter protein [Caldilineaceae bacterium]|nr:ABC-2 family transporter protein [Caldilineaceae bacterium]